MADHIYTKRRQTKNMTCDLCGARGPCCDPPCPVDDEMRRAIALYARVHRRHWKSNLRFDWEIGRMAYFYEGEDLTTSLLRLRNVVGPSGLDRITPATLSEIVNNG